MKDVTHESITNLVCDYFKKVKDNKTGSAFIYGNEKKYNVVHQGLLNHPEIRKDIIKIAAELIGLAVMEQSHLTDVACGIGFKINRLETISKQLFELHEIEKATV